MVSALGSVIDSGEYQNVGKFHGAPANLCDGVEFCCPHGRRPNDFLPWHRLFMVHMEEELGEALPYWDWTEDGVVPALWEGIQAPIQQGATGRCSSSSFTSRSPTINLNPLALKAGVEAALLEETFKEFSDKLGHDPGSPHNEVHGGMGCDMGTVLTAAYDPVFYLHHTYIDYVFAYWQELQRLRGHDAVPTVSGHTSTLAPFNNQQHNSKRITLRNNRGRDTFEYSTNYCYEYEELKFDGLTPAQFLRSKNTPSEETLLCAPPLCAGSPGSPRIFIGLVTPKMMPSGYTTFNLCQLGRCVEAGKKASFGSPNSNSISSQNVDSSSHRLTEYDVTDLVAEQRWDVLDPLEARLTSSLVEGLPQPVIIVRYQGGPGEVHMPQGQNGADYGDLLDRYNPEIN